MESVLNKLRSNQSSGAMLSIEYRLQLLKSLQATIKAMEGEIFQALKNDLGKSEVDSYASEVGFILAEISHAIKHLQKWAKPRKVSTPLFLKPARSYLHYEPKGVVLILGAWNYPFQLTLGPLVAALAAGNVVVVKPSEVAEATENLIDKLLSKALPQEVCKCILGGPDTAQALVSSKFDHIFFTGSSRVGRKIMQSAAENLTPLTLELGGKSPCIVDRNINLSVAAKRIVWGKFYNAGQTCVAPDYLLVHSEIYSKFVDELKAQILAFYGSNPQESEHFGRIVNFSHFDRLMSMLDEGKVLGGGRSNRDEKYLEPTLIEPSGLSSMLMREEIFGPILPILRYKSLDEAFEVLRALPTPLACYLFSNDKNVRSQIQSKVSFGGGCINNTLRHLTNPYLPFGGVGESGFGRYHGQAGFHTFSNEKSVLVDSLAIDLSVKYPPYKGGMKLLKMLFR